MSDDFAPQVKDPGSRPMLMPRCWHGRTPVNPSQRFETDKTGFVRTLCFSCCPEYRIVEHVRSRRMAEAERSGRRKSERETHSRLFNKK